MSGTLSVALYSGRLVEGDAIANSLRWRSMLLRRWARAGAPLQVVEFALDADRTFPHTETVSGCGQLLERPSFRRSLLHIYEFGIYYSLFNSIFALPVGSSAGVVYHNITPPELFEDQNLRRALLRSEDQRYNVLRAAHVVCDSEFNKEQLVVATGYPPAACSVVPLTPPIKVAFAGARSARHGRVELLSVGRPVRSKGLLDLIDVARRLATTPGPSFRLRIVGRLEYGDREVVEQLRNLADDPSVQGQVELLTDHPTERMAQLFEEADVLVVPSYHEGYCVPIVEALASGCHIVAYDNTNLPAVTGGLGQLVRTGDRDGLAAVLADLMRRLHTARTTRGAFLVPTSLGDVAEEAWRDEAAARSCRLPSEAETIFREAFTALVDAVHPTDRRTRQTLHDMKDFLCAPSP